MEATVTFSVRAREPSTVMPRHTSSCMLPEHATAHDALAAHAKLTPLHDRMGPVQPGDWLETKREPGQTFEEYLDTEPVTPRGKRSILYIQPIGPFADEQRKIVELSADFC